METSLVPRISAGLHASLARNTGALKRALYVIALDPSKQFGSLEEQILVQACAFRDRQSLFLPLFSAAPDECCRSQYRRHGLEVAFLDLERFRLGTLRRLLRLIHGNRIAVVHWNMCPPANAYLLALRVIAPSLRHFFTDHSSRPEPGLPRAGFVKRRVKRFL